MILTASQLKTLTYENLDAVLPVNTHENKYLEYKETLPENNHESKKEFLADVSSFANSDGGIIIYGVKDDGSRPGLTGLLADDVILRLENLIRDSIEPRIAGIQILQVPMNATTFLILIYIPKSFIRPHAVKNGKWICFYARNSKGKYFLDVSEIRRDFIASESLSDKIRAFRFERIQTIIDQKTPILIGDGPKFVLHIVPLNSFLGNFAEIFNPVLLNANFEFKRELPQSIINFEGVVYYSQFADPSSNTYLQVFRNGTIEDVDASFTDNSKKYIYSNRFENDYLKKIPSYLEYIHRLDIVRPYLLLFSIINIQGYKILQNNFSYRLPAQHAIDRNILILPEVLLTEDSTKELDVFLKPVFDSVYNACGYLESFNYRNGRFISA